MFVTAAAAFFAVRPLPYHFFPVSVSNRLSCKQIPDPQDEKPGIQGDSYLAFLAELDFFGAISGTTALVLFNFAWNQAPIVGWQSPYIIVTLILGVLLMPLFFYIELRVAEYPLLPLDVFTTDNAFVLGCVACGWASFGIWYYYSWQILYTLRGVTPILGAAYFSPLMISGMFAALTTGYLLARLRSAWVMISMFPRGGLR